MRFTLFFALLFSPSIVFAQTVTSPGPVTVVADDDSSGGDGHIEFKNGATTRLIINDDGTISIVKRLGINNASPAAAIHLKPTYPDDVTAAENVLMFSNPNGHSFGFNLSQTLQGNNPHDDVMMWGWNVDATTPNEPTLRFSMERQFGLNPSNFEVHLETVTPGGGGQRPWTWTINRTTGEAVVVTSGTSHFYGAGWLATGGAELHVQPSSISAVGLFGHVGDVHFVTPSNGGAPAKQIRMVPLPSDSAQTAISFGGTAYLANSLQTVNAYNQFGNPGTFGAGRFSVGSAGMDDSLGIRVAQGQGIRFSANSDPFGGSDVTVSRNAANSLNFFNPDGNVPTTLNGSFNASTQNGASYKVNGTKVVGSQCPAIPDSLGTIKDNRRAINALLACMRSHGMVAQDPGWAPAEMSNDRSAPRPAKTGTTRAPAPVPVKPISSRVIPRSSKRLD